MSSSINTNAQALTALQSLNATNRQLSTAQSRISTGLRVSEASDNAAYWSIATTMRSDAMALSTVQDSLGLGASKIDTAYTALSKTIDTVNEIKSRLVAATGGTAADKVKIDTEIKALQNQLKAYADSATFSGTNMLSVDTTTGTAAAGTADDLKIVAALNRKPDGTVSLSTIDIAVQDIKLFDAYASATGLNDGILDATRLASTGAREATAAAPTGGAAVAAGDTYTVYTLSVAGFSDAQISGMITVLEAATIEMTNAATVLGTAKAQSNAQKTFTQSLMDSIDRGVGQLVDADMNKESTKLQALQVQQQLGIQALSIANGNAQSILSLFRQ
ncbi:MAG TPA: flagellin [Mesorhizobium sp.]|jgi:flagellin|nr:flagellin [Mesorhizobium sp.]